MNYALGGRFAQHLHRFLQSPGRPLGVAAAHRLLGVFDRAMHMSFNGAIAQLAFKAAAMALDGRRMYWNVWHIECRRLTMQSRPVNGPTATTVFTLSAPASVPAFLELCSGRILCEWSA